MSDQACLLKELPRDIKKKEPPSTYWIGSWLGPRVNLDVLDITKSPCPCQESNPKHPVSSLVNIPYSLYKDTVVPIRKRPLMCTEHVQIRDWIVRCCVLFVHLCCKSAHQLCYIGWFIRWWHVPLASHDAVLQVVRFTITPFLPFIPGKP